MPPSQPVDDILPGQNQDPAVLSPGVAVVTHHDGVSVSVHGKTARAELDNYAS